MPNLPPEAFTVGSRPQLFLDRERVEDLDQVRRIVQQPRRDPQEPVLKATLPWEGADAYSGSVLHDPEKGTLRMWYVTRHEEGAADDAEHEVKRPTAAGSYRTGYAESHDGIHWQKPDLKLATIKDAPPANCVLHENQLGFDGKPLVGAPGAGSVCVIEHPDPPDRNHRYVMLMKTRLGHYEGEKTYENQVASRNGPSINFSPDGLRWVRAMEDPIFPYWMDTLNTLIWDPDRRLWVVHCRYYAGTGGDQKQWSRLTRFTRARRVARMESKDLATWSTPTVVMSPDETDPAVCQYYGMPTFWYHGMYIGQAWVWDITTDELEVQLAWSRDGVHFERHPLRQPWITRGIPGTWDSGSVTTFCSPVEVGDELWVYYCGTAGGFHAAVGSRHSIGRAVLRKEGFVSLCGTVETGWVLTKPIICPGGPLFVNANALRGAIQVEVLDTKWIPYRAQPLNGCSREASNVISRNDGVRLPVTWRGRTDRLDDLKGQPVRIRFWLQNAELFSYVFPQGQPNH